MAEPPRLKPKMDAPKQSGRLAGVARDARTMLIEGHQKQRGARQQPDAEPESATQYAIDQMQKRGKKTGQAVADTGSRAVRNYRRLGEREQKATAGKGRLRRQRVAEQQAHSPYRRNAKGATTPKTGGGASSVKAQGRAARLKTARAAAGRGSHGPVANAVREQAAKLAKAAGNAAKKVGQLIAKAAKALARGIIALAGACGPLLIIIIIVAAAGAIIASPFGLFFSGEDNSPGTTAIQQVVAETSNDFRQRIQDLIAATPHDELQMQYTNRGYKRGDNWIDVLAVFAVKTAGADDGIDVVTIDPERIALIRQVFDDMDTIESRIETVAVYDEETDTSTDKIILHIIVTGKGVQEMADAYGFTAHQREILAEMMSGEYDDYFAELIGSAGLFGMVGDGGSVVGTGNFIWPSAASTYVTSPFGTRRDPFTGETDTHLGIDIGAGRGTGVLAADGGTVVSTSVDGSYGTHVLIDHGNGTKTLYAHMDFATVGLGDAVTQGQTIGGVGETGRSKGVHLHFEIWVNGSRVDPLPYFSNYTTAW